MVDSVGYVVQYDLKTSDAAEKDLRRHAGQLQ
jgi:hypothetical protein